ncbi:Uncharacterised protein [Mycobacteroides abscessus subsp. abscessus]|nr:Uncharacterised protein [Mycobacteroides abscessus subsp. abscessus]
MTDCVAQARGLSRGDAGGEGESFRDALSFLFQAAPCRSEGDLDQAFIGDGSLAPDESVGLQSLE